mmetsp:Transcript_68664/g.174385  ORF Transcript_68664/g.174385 Transcript_68664/m.174385 type:complete len:172 (+) Transcript_68664:86-601(+)
MDRALDDDPLDRALPDDDDADDYDRDEDFDGDYRGSGAALELKTGDEELQMDYSVFGRYVESGSKEHGKPTLLGPKTEGARPSIAFCVGPDGKPTWWVYDPSGGECFYAETEADRPPRRGWRKEYGEEDLDVTLEGGSTGDVAAKKEEDGKKRERSRSPKRGESAKGEAKN